MYTEAGGKMSIVLWTPGDEEPGRMRLKTGIEIETLRPVSSLIEGSLIADLLEVCAVSEGTA
jgi:NADH:ubiquinone oxidoreductase subunit D